jgi:hypothetical protein
MAGEPPRGEMEFVLGKLAAHIDSFDGKATWYRWVYFATSIAALVISAAVTVVAGWKHALPPDPTANEQTTNIVLVLSSFLTLLTGYGFFFSPKNSWLLFAAAANRMRALKGKIEFRQADPDPPADEHKLARQFYCELQAILDDTNNGWLDLRRAPAPSTTISEVKTAAS